MRLLPATSLRLAVAACSLGAATGACIGPVGPAGFDVAIVTFEEPCRDALLASLETLASPALVSGRPATGEWRHAELRSPRFAAPYRVLVGLETSGGGDAARRLVTEGVLTWHPRYVLLVGTALSVSEDVETGDVVAARMIWSYEVDGTEVSALRDHSFRGDGSLLVSALAVPEGWAEGLESDFVGPTSSPRFDAKPAASGAASPEGLTPEMKARLRELHDRTLIVEREGAAAAAAIQELRDGGENVGFLMIRGVRGAAGPLEEAGPAGPREKEDSERAVVATARFVSALLRSHWPVRPRGARD